VKVTTSIHVQIGTVLRGQRGHTTRSKVWSLCGPQMQCQMVALCNDCAHH